MKFHIKHAKYTTTRRGIAAEGKIQLNDVPVGTFRQQPFQACIPNFPDQQIKELFQKQAEAVQKDKYDFAESLLREYEKTITD